MSAAPNRSHGPDTAQNAVPPAKQPKGQQPPKTANSSQSIAMDKIVIKV